jgi:hypothetical protein
MTEAAPAPGRLVRTRRVIRAGGVASAGPTAPPNPGGKQRVLLAHGDRGPFTEAERPPVLPL